MRLRILLKVSVTLLNMLHENASFSQIPEEMIRHAVVVTGMGLEKVLGVSVIESGTGWAQAKVIVRIWLLY
jgi:hypothetical protein